MQTDFNFANVYKLQLVANFMSVLFVNKQETMPKKPFKAAQMNAVFPY